MLPQKQPNSKSCMATAFAIAMNVPVSNIFNRIGHTGENNHLDLAISRGFHVQEIVRAFFEDFWIVEFGVIPPCDDSDVAQIALWEIFDLKRDYYDMVLAYWKPEKDYGHTVTWSHADNCFCDPSTGILLPCLPQSAWDNMCYVWVVRARS